MSHLAAAGALLVLAPGTVLAGKRVAAGDQSLRLAALVKPAKAGKGVNLGIQVDYESRTKGEQVTEDTRSITLLLPRGMALHPDRRPACRLSVIWNEGSSRCDPESIVGAGTGTIDARPNPPAPVDAEIVVFNGSRDVSLQGPAPDPAVPALIVEVRSPLVTTDLVFDIRGRRLEADYPDPAGGFPQVFHIQKVELAIPLEKGKQPYVTAPRTCSGRWPFAMTITSFDGPSITARHAVRCVR